jgi:DNA-binding PadR family transcriptional regulator
MVEGMREPTFMILSVLAPGPLHGYGVIRSVEAASQGRVRLRAGTLYAALDRLTHEGLVVPHGQEVVDGRLRRYYALTDDGAAALAAEVDRLRRNVHVAVQGLRARPT